MIHPNEIRTGVDERGIVWLKLQFCAEWKLREHENADDVQADLRRHALDKIYGDANDAVCEMEYAVMSSLRGDANRDRIAEMFRKLRSTIPLDSWEGGE